jgi:putative spermidine/putrescine transport system ATP-binding protein
VVQPEVFLLDEPLSNLDAKLRHDVRIEIRQLQRKLGLTTVFVTHDQEEALTVADRLIVMNKGEIEQIGTPEELYNRPRTHFVADFLGKSNFFTGRLEGEGVFRSKGGTALRFAGPVASGASLVAVRPEKLRLAPAGASVDALNSARGRVELVTFLGAIIETIVRLESGETVTVHSQNQAVDRPYPVGTDVLVHWDADANLVLEEPAPQAA